MIRIFSLLSAFIVLMILVAGGGAYWMSQSDISLARQKAMEANARSIALSVSYQVNTLQETVNKMALAPIAITAMKSNNPLLIAETALKLEQYLPHVMKIRLLPVDVSELDLVNVPHMGHADLVMVQESLVKKPFPAIQGKGENRHLAITAVIKSDDEPIGIILASLSYNFIKSSFNKSAVSNGFIELKQNNLTLAKTGDSENKTDAENIIKVANTIWDIRYWPDSSQNQMSLALMGIILVPLLLGIAVLFISYRNLTRIIRLDLDSTFKAIQDLIAGKKIGSYPMILVEMKSMISNIIQYKRIQDHDDISLSIQASTDSFDDDFFSESSELSINDTSIDFSENSSFLKMSSGVTPLALDNNPQSTRRPPPPLKNKLTTQDSIFKPYSIQGVAGGTLSSSIVFDIGRAVGTIAIEYNIKTVVLGEDGRTSSPALSESFSKGIISTGINILNLGLVPSPVVYFVTQHTEGKSGVIITGSHQSANNNGLKIIINGKFLTNTKIQQIIKSKSYYQSTSAGSIEQNSMFTNEYVGAISEDIKIARPMKVVVDCANGAAGELAPILLKTLGCEVIELFCEIDGSFPNHQPDPSKAENLGALVISVQQNKADIGIALDGDGNRLGVVDSKGKIIWPDRLMMLFAKDVLNSYPKATIIYDVKCSRLLDQQITKLGGKPLMWKSGHTLIKAKVEETNAKLAGEMSGHIFFNDRWFGFDDALYAAARLIQILSQGTRDSHAIFAEFPENINSPEIIIHLAEGESAQIMEEIMVQAHFNDGRIIKTDGLRVDFAHGWGLIRASNTSSALTIRFEGDSKDALRRIQSLFKDLLIKVKPDISLPF